jgi:hypothetical protein
MVILQVITLTHYILSSILVSNNLIINKFMGLLLFSKQGQDYL